MWTGSRRNARIVSTYCIHSSPLFGFFWSPAHCLNLLWPKFCLVWLVGHHQRFQCFWDHMLYDFWYPTLDFTKAKLIKRRKPLHAHMTCNRPEGSLSALAKHVWNNANQLWGVMFNNWHSQVPGSSGYEFGGTLCFFIACHRRLLEFL